MRRPVTLLLLGLLVACDTATSSTPTNGSLATLRLVQTDPGASAVTLLLDGTAATASVNAGQFTGLLAIGSGDRQVSLSATGRAVGPARSYSFAEGQQYTVLAQDSVGTLIPVVLADTGLLPVAGKSKLRVIHSAPNAPPIDIWRTQPDYDTLIRVQFPFPFLSVSPYIQSDPGDWTLVVTPENQTDTLAATGTVTVGGGKLVTVLVVDGATAGQVEMVVVPDN